MQVGVTDAAAVERSLRSVRGRFASPGFVPVSGAGDGAVSGALVRDPDGHAVLVMGR